MVIAKWGCLTLIVENSATLCCVDYNKLLNIGLFFLNKVFIIWNIDIHSRCTVFGH